MSFLSLSTNDIHVSFLSLLTIDTNFRYLGFCAGLLITYALGEQSFTAWVNISYSSDRGGCQ